MYFSKQQTANSKQQTANLLLAKENPAPYGGRFFFLGL